MASVKTKISRKVFITFTTLGFAFLGFLLGLLGLLASLNGAGVFFQLFAWRITGVTAGMVGVPLWTALFGLLGLVIGLVAYKPVRWIQVNLF